PGESVVGGFKDAVSPEWCKGCAGRIPLDFSGSIIPYSGFPGSRILCQGGYTVQALGVAYFFPFTAPVCRAPYCSRYASCKDDVLVADIGSRGSRSAAHIIGPCRRPVFGSGF